MELTTIKIVNKGCDLYPLGSYHKVLGEKENVFRVKPHDFVLKDWCEVAEMTTLTIWCTSCSNHFDSDHEFKDGVCIRCWERHNIVNRK